MADVRIKLNQEVRINSDLAEKLKVKGDTISLRGFISIRAEVDKNGNVFYLGQKSVEAMDLEHFLSKGQIKFYDQEKELDNDRIYPAVEELLVDEINKDIEAGSHDDRIKEAYKKDKSSIKVDKSDVAAGRHRESPLNKNIGHNWIPEKAPEEQNTCPEFSIYDNKTNEKLASFTSVAACSHQFKINSGSIIHCLRGDRELCEGYYFQFTRDNSSEVDEWFHAQELKRN